MSASGGPIPLDRIAYPTLPLLVVVTLALAFDTPLAGPEKVLAAALALGGIALATTMRLVRRPLVRATAPVPVLAGLGLLAAVTPVAAVPGLLAGVAGIVAIVWMLDDPLGPAHGVRRGLLVWSIPAIAVGVAWASASLLPSSSAPVGIAGALLAGALVVLAYLVRRPQLFDQEAPTTL